MKWGYLNTRSTTGIAMSLAIATFTGCTTIQTTTPARSATEQLLLSTSVDNALADVDLSIFAHQKVFVDATYFDSYDPKYATGAIRDVLSRQGALLVDTAATADVIIEARSGGLSIDNSETLFGIPAMGLPVPMTGAIAIPELAIYKSDRQHAFAKIVLLAYVRVTREHVYSSGSLDGKSYSKDYKLLGASWKRTDIPEKHKESERGQYEVSYPQYNPEALPVPTPVVPPPSTNAAPQKSLISTNAVPSTNMPPVSTNSPGT